MAFVRKYTLYQLKDINNSMPEDLGEETTQDYPKPHIDHQQNYDMDYEDSYDKSNEIIGTYGCGNFGENFGDCTNDGNYANVLAVRNPLNNKYIDTIEDFGTMFGFGDTWHNRDGKKVQHFDEPDDKLFPQKPTKKKKNSIKESSVHIYKFNEFIKS